MLYLWELHRDGEQAVSRDLANRFCWKRVYRENSVVNVELLYPSSTWHLVTLLCISHTAGLQACYPDGSRFVCVNAMFIGQGTEL